MNHKGVQITRTAHRRRTRVRAGLRRTTIAVLAVFVLVSALMTACTPKPPAPPKKLDLEAWIEQRVSDLDPADPYMQPSDDDQDAVADALRATSAGTPPDMVTSSLTSMRRLSGLGIREQVRVDSVSGKRMSMLFAEDGTPRAWGVIVYQPGVPVRTVIEVPHARSDIDTELLGADLFRRMPNSALVVSGAHRRAGGGGIADMAHVRQSIFQTAVLTLATKASVEVQVHGFDGKSLRGVDAIPSPGPTKVSPRHRALASALRSEGFHVCDGWTSKCGDLRGHTNVQGAAAADRGTPFLHLELAKALRQDPANRAKLVHALARTWGK